MKQKSAIFILVACLLLAFVWTTQGQGSGFIIEFADDSNTLNMTASTELNTLTANVPPHMIIEFANAVQGYNTVSVPSGLQTLLGQVAPRMVIEYANDNRYYSLNYPLALIGDTTKPIVSGVSTISSGDDVAVRWVTNEYTVSKLEYGVQSSVYPNSITDNFYRQTHEIKLSALTEGQRYYFRLINTDRSGNNIYSSQYSFVVNRHIYLPYVVK